MNGDVLAFGNAISQALAKVFASDAIRRSSPVSALLVASPVALLIGLLAAAFFQAPLNLTAGGWGGLAGLVGGVGLVFNFRALAVGTVAVVIPVMTCASTTLQVGASWVIEGRPELGTLVGAVLCVLAVGVISWRTEDDLDRERIRQTVGYAIAAGACFAGFGVIINHGAGGSSLWRILAVRACCTDSAPRPLSRCTSSRKPLTRSTRVATALREPSEPMIRSPSQCPGTARSST